MALMSLQMKSAEADAAAEAEAEAEVEVDVDAESYDRTDWNGCCKRQQQEKQRQP